MESELSEEQKQALSESLTRGSAFEEMVRSQGWGFIKAYYQAKIQRFATSLLLEENKPISDFEAERRELIGLRKLIGLIDNDIKALENDRQKNKPVAKK